jgi:hypothetical protein
MPAISPVLQTCFFCGAPIRGRSDKKFCDPGCKNAFSNQIQRQERAEISQIDLILKQNRRILKQCLDSAAHKLVPRQELVRKGYRFEYHTHHYMNKRLEEYCFCYDYGYLEMGEGRLLVVRQKTR